MTTSGLEPITRRQRAHLATIEDVKEVAKRRLLAEGLSALSLRSVARDMGLVPSALYRYFPSHAHLLSALAADAADSLVDAVREAQEGPAADDYRGRWSAAVSGYRDWVLNNSPGYQLNFGESITAQLPDIGAQDVLPRLIGLLSENLAAAEEAGQLKLDVTVGDTDLPHTPQQSAPSVPKGIFTLALTSWTSMHGMVAMETSGRLRGMGVPPEQAFEQQLELVTSGMGFIA